MSAIVIPDTNGLDTHGNDLSAKVGSTSVADNVDFGREGRPERRRGFKNHSTNLPDFRPEQLIASAAQDQAYLHLDNGIWYFDGSNWQRKAGAFGAKLSALGHLWHDSVNDILYIPGRTADVIFKFVPATGALTVFAGRYNTASTTDGVGDAARFDRPQGIWGDGAGNLFVCDQGNHTIRKIVISTRTVSTLAGTGGASGTTDDTGALARFNLPSNLWGDGTNLYVADQGNHTIRKIVISSGVVTTLAGTGGASGTTDDTGSAARFSSPASLWGDGAGVLYVADEGNHSVRKVTYPAGVVTTFAGLSGTSGTTNATGTAARFTSPRGIWGDGAGVMYVNSAGGVRRVTYPGAVVTTLASDSAAGVWGGGSERLYMSGINSELLALYLDTSDVVVLAGDSDGSTSVGHTASFADGVIVGPD